MVKIYFRRGIFHEKVIDKGDNTLIVVLDSEWRKGSIDCINDVFNFFSGGNF